MESKLVKQSEQALIAASRRMTPEQRLEAFLTHCRLMVGLYTRDKEFEQKKKPCDGMRTRSSGESALLDFIAMKVFAGSPQDLSDARHALAAAGNELDAALLRRVTSRYGKFSSEILEKLLAE